MNDALMLISITLLPFLELRASIPYGILQTDFHWGVVFAICVISNAILGPIVYLLINKCLHLFCYMSWFEKLWHKKFEKIQKKIHKNVECYGSFALIAFIGMPLPGSGSYSGAIAATVLGMDMKDFTVANIFGVLIAGIVVTIAAVTGAEILQWVF